MDIGLEYIKSLAKIASEEGLTELKVSSGDKQVVIKKEKETHIATAIPSVPALPVSAPVMQAATELHTAQPAVETKDAEVVIEAKASSESTQKGTPVLSPMVGTYYAAPSPDAEPYVKAGQSIKVGQVLCIIESMKLMNEIESEVSGTVLEICVENGEAVEAEQVLMYIE